MLSNAIYELHENIYELEKSKKIILIAFVSINHYYK